MSINESILSMLLAIALCTILFLWWKISQLTRATHTSDAPFKENEFQMISRIIEEERSRISAELHDELGTLLSIIYLDLELVTHEASALTPYGENRLMEIKRNLNQVIESIRTNIWNLSGQLFNDVDLGFSIRELCHKLDRYKGTHVTFVQSGVPFDMNEKFKINLFRITQELLTNTLKHSSAWNISIHIDWNENHSLSIAIEDDGQSYVERRNTDGMGVLNISRRAEYIKATITKESLSKGHKTTVTAQVVP